MIAIELPQELELQLEAAAKASGRTAADYARETIIERLEELEDVYLAERELIEVRAGRSETVSLGDFARQYGLED